MPGSSSRGSAEMLDRLAGLVLSGELATELLEEMARSARVLAGAASCCLVFLSPDGTAACVGEEAPEGWERAVLAGEPVAAGWELLPLARGKRIFGAFLLRGPSADLGGTEFATLRALALLILENLSLRSEEVERARAVSERDAAVATARQKADLLRAVIRAQEEERKRVARELHDQAGQALISVLLALRHIETAETLEAVRERVKGLREEVARAAREVRDLAWALRPPALDDLSLTEATERQLRELAEKGGFEFSFHAFGLEGGLPREVETVVYRVVQEALTNAYKHAKAKHVSVVLERHGETLKAVVEDDGVGFVPEVARQGGRGLGLAGMEERAALLGGKVHLESGPGEGTTVVVEIPLGSVKEGGGERV